MAIDFPDFRCDFIRSPLVLLGKLSSFPIPVILLILLFIPFRPVCWLWEICLICFGVEWLISAYQLYLRRIAAGMPFALGTSILVACGILTMLSAIAFFSHKVKNRYPLHV